MNAPVAVPPDTRTSEILSGVRRAFVEKGFDGGAMQDLARAAGMSVGNFYRYFPSKAAIVEALITRDLVEVETEFSAIEKAPDPMERLRSALHSRVRENMCEGEGQLWAEIGAAALRKPEIGAISQQMENQILRHLTAAFGLATGLPRDVAAARYNAHARLIMLLVKGVSMNAPDAGPQGAQLTALILRTLDRTLDEIASDAPKGKDDHA